MRFLTEVFLTNNIKYFFEFRLCRIWWWAVYVFIVCYAVCVVHYRSMEWMDGTMYLIPWKHAFWRSSIYTHELCPINVHICMYLNDEYTHAVLKMILLLCRDRKSYRHGKGFKGISWCISKVSFVLFCFVIAIQLVFFYCKKFIKFDLIIGSLHHCRS